MRLSTENKQYRNLYIFTLCIAMFGRVGKWVTPWWWQYIHCVIWIGLYLYKYQWKLVISERTHLSKCQSMIWKMYMWPYIIYWLCLPIGYIFYASETNFRMFTRSISTTLQMTLVFFAVIATASFFKGNLLKYTFVALAINYFIIIVVAVALCGISDFITYGLFPWKDFPFTRELRSSAVLEVHDVTFAAGFFFIYLMVFYKHIKHRKLMLFCCLILLYFGYKRTEVLICILLMFIMVFINSRYKKSLQFWNILYSVGTLIVCYGWIWLLDSNFFTVLTTQYGIEFNSRDKLYAYMNQFFNLSPFYVGRGMSAAIKINEAAIAEGQPLIHGHSDIMLNYIDFGFWGFLIWILFCTYYITQRLFKSFSNEASKLWLLFTTYAFVTYLTDNTTTYFAFQTSYAVIMFHVLYTGTRLPEFRWGKTASVE